MMVESNPLVPGNRQCRVPNEGRRVCFFVFKSYVSVSFGSSSFCGSQGSKLLQDPIENALIIDLCETNRSFDMPKQLQLKREAL